MKKTIYIIISLLLALLSCSCTRNRNEDAYFLHAIGFSEENGEYRIFACSEKQSGEKINGKSDGGKLSVIQSSGKTIDEASKHLLKNNSIIYPSTAEIYIIESIAEKKLTEQLSKDLCDSSILPSKGRIICTDVSIHEFFSALDSIEKTNALIKITENDKLNIIPFLSKCMQNKSCFIQTVGFDNNGELLLKEKTEFQKE